MTKKFEIAQIRSRASYLESSKIPAKYQKDFDSRHFSDCGDALIYLGEKGFDIVETHTFDDGRALYTLKREVPMVRQYLSVKYDLSFKGMSCEPTDLIPASDSALIKRMSQVNVENLLETHGFKVDRREPECQGHYIVIYSREVPAD